MGHDTYALPRRYYQAGICRYGFHGLSYDYVSRRLRDIAPDQASGQVIIAHLGAGASICALTATLGGLDMLVFCGGIGEHSAQSRARIYTQLSWMGLTLDTAQNTQNGPNNSTADAQVQAMVIPTNEEQMIADYTGALMQ